MARQPFEAAGETAAVARVDEIRKYDAGLSSPTYTWPAPTVEKQDKERKAN